MTRFAGPTDSPGFLLWHVTLEWQRRVTAALAPLGLTHVQFVLLACAWWLQTHGEEPNQRDVARQAGTDLTMTSQVLRALEAKGLLERRADPADLRARKIVVTEDGVRLAQRAVPAVEAVDDEVLGAAGDDLVAALRRIAGSTGAHAASPGAPTRPERAR